MEAGVVMFAVQEQEMRTQRQIEGSVEERQMRQFRGNITTLLEPVAEVGKKKLHRLHACREQFSHGFEVVPHEILGIVFDLCSNDGRCVRDALADLGYRELIERVRRNHFDISLQCLRVEGGRPVTATQD